MAQLVEVLATNLKTWVQSRAHTWWGEPVIQCAPPSRWDKKINYSSGLRQAILRALRSSNQKRNHFPNNYSRQTGSYRICPKFGSWAVSQKLEQAWPDLASASDPFTLACWLLFQEPACQNASFYTPCGYYEKMLSFLLLRENLCCTGSGIQLALPCNIQGGFVVVVIVVLNLNTEARAEEFRFTWRPHQVSVY